MVNPNRIPAAVDFEEAVYKCHTNNAHLFVHYSYRFRDPLAVVLRTEKLRCLVRFMVEYLKDAPMQRPAPEYKRSVSGLYLGDQLKANLKVLKASYGGFFARRGVQRVGEEAGLPTLADVEYMSGEALETFIEQQRDVWCAKPKSSLSRFLNKLF